MDIHSNMGTEANPGCVRRWREYVRRFPDEIQTLNSDSANAIANMKSPPGWLTEALRHVKTSFHFCKQFFFEKLLALQHTRGEENCADILTKGMGAKTGQDNQKTPIFQKHAMYCLGYRNPLT